MSDQTARQELSRALLRDVAPDEGEFFDVYDAAAANPTDDRLAGTGFGPPPEFAGLLGMAAVLVGQSIFDKVLEWSADLAGEVAKKVLTDAAAEQLKRWLRAPAKESLGAVLTGAGKVEILAIVERDARAAGLSKDDQAKLLAAAARQLGLTR
ncbi:hypothetical protein [Microvirga arsenatis]|uniref:Uncharacterized protein n=1 Tax=Microvirga arsenatis TaxID=2692265 RepID=A0ABW9YWG4_9HYPH|nr:hypothetical protein [Microvirga arsenatis]NBJ10936.1 hypothetical protein [Microvirga arsenatis]NBJ24167.1 hypothetical protein [Microvirga arsenatis]